MRVRISSFAAITSKIFTWCYYSFFLIIVYMLRIQSMCLQFLCGTICFDGYRGFCCWIFLLGNIKFCFSQEEFMKVIQPLKQPRTFKTDAFFVRKAVLNFFCDTLWSVNQQMAVNFAIFITKAFNLDWTSQDFWITWFSPQSERDNFISVVSTNNPRNFICIFG